MKIKVGLLTVAAAGALIAVRSAKAPAGFGFSKRSIRGSYASTFQGSVIQGSSLLPINGTAVLTADGNGNISGHESFVFNGTICTDVASTGTYTVNPDGSGTTSFKFTSTPECSGTYTQSLAIAESGSIVVLNNTNADKPDQRDLAAAELRSALLAQTTAQAIQKSRLALLLHHRLKSQTVAPH